MLFRSGAATDNSSGKPSSQPPGQSAQQGVLGGSGVAPGNLPMHPGSSSSAVQNGQPENAPSGNFSPASGQQSVQPSFSLGLQAQTGTNQGMNVSESSDSSGPVMGGFIIGVAGKSEQSSIKVYKGGVTYKQWEFIFNPLEQVQRIGTVLTTGSQQQGTALFGMPQPPQPPQNPQQR